MNVLWLFLHYSIVLLLMMMMMMMSPQHLSPPYHTTADAFTVRPSAPISFLARTRLTFDRHLQEYSNTDGHCITPIMIMKILLLVNNHPLN